MKLQTKIGSLEIKEQDIIQFPVGLLGFAEFHRYVIIEKENSVFSFLQSVDEPDLTFVIIMPELVCCEYSVKLEPEEIDLLRISAPEDGRIYAIVTVPEDAAAMTVNLQAPLVVNMKNRFGAQIVIVDGPYHTRHNLLAEMQKNEFLLQKKLAEQEKQEGVRESG